MHPILRSQSVYLRQVILLILFALPASGFAQAIELLPLPLISGIPASPNVGTIIAVDFHPKGGYVLIESTNQRLLHFDNKGVFVDEAGGFGFGEGSFRGATDITQAGFEIWISDPLAGQIIRYDLWLAPLEPWTGTLERGVEAQFLRPVSVARAASGDVVVIEQDRAELLLLDPEGRLVERVGSFGEMNRRLVDPVRVEISPSGIIAIADPGQQAVFLFDRFGNPRGYRPWNDAGYGPTSIAWLGELMFVAGPERLRLLNPRGQIIHEWDSALFGGPIHDLACDDETLLIAVGSTVLRFRVDQNPVEE